MRLSRIIRIAVQAIRSNVPSSIVTVLEIVVGVAAMLAVLPVEAGVGAMTRERLAEIGNKLILARPAEDAPETLTSGAAPAVAAPAARCSGRPPRSGRCTTST